MSTTQLKIVIEKHPEGYVAYPLGMKGIVIGEGDTYEEALEDVKSAIKFHIETFGEDVFELEEVMDMTPLTMPNHKRIKGPTLRIICRQAGIKREEFLKIYEKI